MRAPALLGGVEELLEQAQLPVTPDQRRLETVHALQAADRGDDAAGTVQPGRLGLALERVLPGVGVGDGRGGQGAGGGVDQDLARPGRGLDPGRRVDRVAGHHPLVGRPQGRRDLTGDDADP